MTKEVIGTLQVILKIVERCNLNCSYCYYYSGADAKTDLRPAVITRANIVATTDFLLEACRDFQVRNLSIIFHGGEPTLLKPSVFDWMCAHISEKLSRQTSISFSIQTNAVHLSNEWMGLLKKYKVNVGVSLDGTELYNDTYRIDHKGLGSHARVRRTIEKLSAAVDAGELNRIGLVCVLNKDYDYAEIYRHFTSELKFSYLNFLLPDINRDADQSVLDGIECYGAILCDIFDQWLEFGLGSVKVRQFEELLKFFHGKINYVSQPDNYISNQIIVIHSDGHVAVDDTLMPAMSWYRNRETADVRSTSLAKWLSQPVFSDISNARATLPKACIPCRWVNICRGGDIENRFSEKDGFLEKSIYCSALIRFYNHVAETLEVGGYPPTLLADSISGHREPVHGYEQ